MFQVHGEAVVFLDYGGNHHRAIHHCLISVKSPGWCRVWTKPPSFQTCVLNFASPRKRQMSFDSIPLHKDERWNTVK